MSPDERKAAQAASRPFNEEVEGYKPAIPPMVRTIVYIVGLTWSILALLANGLAAVWWPDHAQAILATTGAGSTAMAALAASLGVAYRPTRHLTPTP